jgi:hypothetical protein
MGFFDFFKRKKEVKPKEEAKKISLEERIIIHPEELPVDQPLGEPFDFIDYSNVAQQPNIVTDGMPHPTSTIMNALDSKTLFSNAPTSLQAPTSTGTILNLLAHPNLLNNVIYAAHPKHIAVTSQHRTADGLLAAYCLRHATWAQKHADLLRASMHGAFISDTFESREAARIAFALKAAVDAKSSPFSPETFAEKLSSPHRVTAAVYHKLAAIIPALVEDPDDFIEFWKTEDDFYQVTLDAIHAGLVEIEQLSNLDLAIVKIDDAIPDYHRAAIFSHLAHGPEAENLQKVLLGHRHSYSLEQRHQYSSPVNVDGLANILNEHESRAHPTLAATFWFVKNNQVGMNLSANVSNLEWLLVKDEVVRYLAERKLDVGAVNYEYDQTFKRAA